MVWQERPFHVSEDTRLPVTQPLKDMTFIHCPMTVALRTRTPIYKDYVLSSEPYLLN